MKKTRKPANSKTSGKKPAKTAAATKAGKKKVVPIPRGYHTITPHLVFRNSADAIAFYKKAFNAKELALMPMPGGGTAHAEIQIGDSRLMLGDEMPSMGVTAPATIGGTPVQLSLYVKNVDEAFAQAVAAGAKVDMPPTDMFWGDRYAKLVDPFGHRWGLATHIEDMSLKEMNRRGLEFMKQMAQSTST